MKMLHVTIQTKYFEEEMKFFMEHVGLEIVNDMRPFGRNMVFLANGAGETNIEIIENMEADVSGNRYLSVGFKTDDVEGKREAMIASSFEVTPMITPAPNVKFFFVKDPAGVNIQFM